MYLHHKEVKKEPIDQKKVARISLAVTAVMGIVAVVIAISPPSIIVWNMFAFGGLQTAFFWTLVLGFFWKKANATGALLGMVGGLTSYCVTMAIGFQISSFHQIIIGIVVALICFVIGNAIGKPTDEKTSRLFFPEKYWSLPALSSWQILSAPSLLLFIPSFSDDAERIGPGSRGPRPFSPIQP